MGKVRLLVQFFSFRLGSHDRGSRNSFCSARHFIDLPVFSLFYQSLDSRSRTRNFLIPSHTGNFIRRTAEVEISTIYQWQLPDGFEPFHISSTSIITPHV